MVGANPLMPFVKESNWLESVVAITVKPNVTIAKYHAFKRTHAKPISKPIPAEIKPPKRSRATWRSTDSAPIGMEPTPKNPITAKVTLPPIRADANPPMPRNAACPSDPCPEFARKFQLAA